MEMEINTGFFAGIKLIGKYPDFSLSLFDSDLNYSGNGFNIWVVKNNRWNLLSDEQGNPIEYPDQEDAEYFGAKYFGKVDRNKICKAHEFYPENYYLVRKSPGAQSSFEYLNLSVPDAFTVARKVLEEIELTFSEKEFFELTYVESFNLEKILEHLPFSGCVEKYFLVLMVAELLNLKNPDEQSSFWKFLLRNRTSKSFVSKLQHSDTFQNILTTMFAYTDDLFTESYRKILSVLGELWPVRISYHRSK